LEAALRFLSAEHPDAVTDVLCGGPQDIQDRYHVPATPFLYYKGAVSGIPAIALKTLAKLVDAWRITRWVRRHDVVLIPGMGVLEGSLPSPPWSGPLRFFLVSLSGRLSGTKVGYVSVGVGDIKNRLTRWLYTQAARLATYHSCRDSRSRDVLGDWGIDTATVPVYPDLAFALPVPPPQAGDPKIVCVGVMDYHGSDIDRGKDGGIRDAYIAEMMLFICWLLETGRDVRLIVGDGDGSDGAVRQQMMADLQERMPGLREGRLIAPPTVWLTDVLAAMAPAGSVVAIRFHNVIASLMLGKPTIAIGYGTKHKCLMEDSGVPEFCTPVKTLDHERLAALFTELSDRAPHLRNMLRERKEASELLLAKQFAEISQTLITLKA
jgi:polysaccharide pyruvyl transferase WcaK-like protein